MSERKDNLSRLYREGAWPEPSRQIDQAILAASRRAAREQHSFARRWAPSFAVAATVVLASAIVLKVVREQPDVLSPSAPEKDSGIRVTRESPVAEPKAAESRRAPAPAAQPAEPPRGFSSTMDNAEAERLDRLKRDLDLRQTVPASESPLPALKPALADKPALKKEAEPQRKLEAPQSARAREQKPSPVSVFGAAPPAAALAPSPAPPPAQATPPAAVTGALSVAKAPERTPQAWIEDIRKLMKEGMFEEAGAQIAEFKKRYPDYLLPEDLR